MIALDKISLAVGGHQVLRQVTFDVSPGETKAILGSSGCGKTTILRVILGLIRPDEGAVFVGSEDLTTLREKDLYGIRQQMAMVFQGAALFDSLTVRENVGYRLWEQARLPDQAIEKTVHECLEFVGLEDTIEKMPAELSGGMRKRVGIARALATGAQILLYDEPTAGLDPINACTVNKLILRLKAKGVTQIVVTHDLETVARVADRVVMVHEGRVIFEGTPVQLHASELAAVREFLDPGSTAAGEWLFPPRPEHTFD